MRQLSLNVTCLGHLEDLGNSMGDIFARKLMQIPNLETVFESEQVWNFLGGVHLLIYC